MNVSPWIRQLALIAFLIALLPLLGLTETELTQREIMARQALPVEYYNLPPSPVLRSLAFGYHELAADLIWVRAISYFADHLTSDRDFRHLERYLDNILALDEHFKVIYRYGPSMMMSRGEKQTNKDVLAAIQLLKRAHRLYPDDYQFPLYIGAYYIGELRTRSAAQRARWRREGADWVYRASLIGANLSWLPSLAAAIYSEQGQRDLAIRYLEELYLTTQDAEMKIQIAGKLKQLQAAKQHDDLERAATAFEQAYHQSGIDFVPRDLFIFLRQPKLLPFSVRALVAPEAVAN